MATKLFPFLILLLLGLLASPLLSADTSVVSAAYAAKSERWQQFYSDVVKAKEAEQVQKTNRFYNRLPFRSDEALWGQHDYWATPAEFLAVGAGDCEDYAIAKYFTLLSLGVPPSKLNLVYVKKLAARGSASAHMVVSFQPDRGSDIYVLDSLTSEILPLRQRADLRPVYGFGYSGLWLIKGGQFKKVGDAEQLSLWRNLSFRLSGLLIAQR